MVPAEMRRWEMSVLCTDTDGRVDTNYIFQVPELLFFAVNMELVAIPRQGDSN